MNRTKLLINKQEELLSLHKILMEAKFNPNPADMYIAGSPITAELAHRVLATIIEMQSETNPTKRESWLNWLEKKKQWIWSRSLSHMLKFPPNGWSEMESEAKRDYIKALFSPFKIIEEDVIRFIEEFEKYRMLMEEGKSINIRGFGQATEEMIERVERQISLLLPEDYKQFLREYNGGKVLVHYCTFVIEELNEVIPLEILFGIDVENRYSLMYWNSFKDEFPKNYIVIGEAAEGGKILLGTENKEGVYYWSNIFRNDPASEEGIYKIGDNFDSFMKSLKKFIKAI